MREDFNTLSSFEIPNMAHLWASLRRLLAPAPSEEPVREPITPG